MAMKSDPFQDGEEANYEKPKLTGHFCLLRTMESKFLPMQKYLLPTSHTGQKGRFLPICFTEDLRFTFPQMSHCFTKHAHEFWDMQRQAWKRSKQLHL